MVRKRAGNAERARLEALIAAVTDGGEIDWIEAERSAVDPAQRQIVANLQVLAQVARVRQAVPAAPPVTPPAAAPPSTWGRFDIRGTIGSGNYGTVFRAWEPRLEREVALKLLSDLDSPDAEATLIHEARLLARVHHSNVVMVYDADKADGCVGLWMELVEGRTLKEIVTEQGPFSAQEALLVGLDLCGALAAVHGADERRRQVGPRIAQRRAPAGGVGLAQLVDRVGRDRKTAADQVVQQDAQAVEICLVVRRGALQDLGRHVQWRSA